VFLGSYTSQGGLRPTAVQAEPEAAMKRQTSTLSDDRLRVLWKAPVFWDQGNNLLIPGQRSKRRHQEADLSRGSIATSFPLVSFMSSSSSENDPSHRAGATI
jgi:hypothetical protein